MLVNLPDQQASDLMNTLAFSSDLVVPVWKYIALRWQTALAEGGERAALALIGR